MKIFGVHTDGGFADYLCVPAHRLYPVPADLDLRTASLTEPVAVAVHGLRRAQFQAGQRLLVLGAGVIGLAVVGVARAWGAREILLTARHPHQAELGRRMGADRVLSEPESTLEALTALGQETPVEMVAETVGGTSSTLMLAGAALAPGGTVLVLGLSLAPVPVSTFPLLNKEARLQWSNCYYSRYPGGSDFQESLRLIRQHGSIFAQMLTHSVPLDSVDRGVAIASDKKLGSVKVTVMIQP
jgi:threonine dehydrogenase-like Zn-dependent dehydrogenase